MTTNGNGRNGHGEAATMPPPSVLDLSALAPTAPAFSEAPASVNTRVSWRGHDVQLTLRGESGAAVLARLDAALTWLSEHGATPAAATHGRPAAAATDAAAPCCPAHGRPMKPGRSGGWFCPVKVAEDDGTGRPAYCRQRVTEGGKR